MIKGLSVSSIIMSCYNGSDYIKRSFSSVLNQNYPNIELIFVDDGSTDNSYEVARSYVDVFEARGYRLKLFCQSNQGSGYAAINMIPHASGKYLSYLDVDDELTPESVSLRVRTLEENASVNVVRTNALKYYEKGERIIQLVTNIEEKCGNDLFSQILVGNANNYAGTYMVRSSVIHDFYKGREIPRSKYGQNLQLLLPGLYHAKSLFIDQPLMIYHIHEGSHSEQKSLQRKIELLEGYRDIRLIMLDYFSEPFKDLRKEIDIVFTRKILDTILANRNKEDDSLAVGEYQKWYERLKLLGGDNLEYRMYSAVLGKSIFQYFWRVLFKLNTIIK